MSDGLRTNRSAGAKPRPYEGDAVQSGVKLVNEHRDACSKMNHKDRRRRHKEIIRMTTLTSTTR